MKKAVFITGTGTDVGKTYVTALITKKLREAGVNAGYYKAAASGNERVGGKLQVGDCRAVGKMSGIPGEYDNMVSYCYEAAVSPHLAAILEGNPVEPARVEADYKASFARFDVVTAEGSGGIVCPIRWDEQHILLEHVIKLLRLPVLIVSEAGLGSINAAVLTASYLKGVGIETRGILLNRYDGENFLHRDNRMMMEQLSGVPVVGTVDENGLQMTAEQLLELYEEVTE